jgi:hypothetical protein
VNIAKPRSSHAGDLPVMTMRHTSLENDVRDLVSCGKRLAFDGHVIPVTDRISGRF